MVSKSPKSDVVFHNETIQGIVDFASVHAPKAKYNKQNSKFDNDKEFSVTLRLDNPATLKAMETLLNKHNFSSTVLNPNSGTQVPRLRPDKDGLMKIQFKRNYVTNEGKVNSIPVVKADGKTPLPPEVLVGNGSEAVIYLTMTTDANTGEGKSIILTGLQVLNLSAPSGPKFKNYVQPDDSSTTETVQQSSPF